MNAFECHSVRISINYSTQREKRRKELVEKEKEKAELEKKELELTKLRQQLQEQETKDKVEADKKDEVSSPIPLPALLIEESAKDDKGEPSTDEDSDEENVPPPRTPPEPVWIQVADSS